jgi:hypothetical protein
VPTSCGYRKGSLCGGLANDIIETLTRCLPLKRWRSLIARLFAAIQNSNDLGKAPYTYNSNPLNDGSLCTAHLRNDDSLKMPLRSSHGVRGYSRSLLDLPCERELSTQSHISKCCLRHSTERASERNSDGKIERCALLLNLRRSEINQDLLRGIEATVLQR